MDISSPHILIVEDDEKYAERIRRTFSLRSERVRLTIVRSLQEARARIRERSPDVVITNSLLPDGKGIQLLSSMSEEAAFPVLVMLEHEDEEMAVEAMKAGALDYIVKSADTFANMPHIVERTLREWENIVQRKYAEHALLTERISLAQTVMEQTAELRKFNQDLQHVSHLKDEFLANMSHKLHTPLHVILEHAQVLQHVDNLTEYQRKHLQAIEKSGDQLLHLINTMLDVANMKAGKEVSEPTSPSEIYAQTVVGYVGKRRTVLVADDHEANRAILVDRLLLLGFRVLEAENGQECLEKAFHYHPDIILLDLWMPIMSGFETAEQIRRTKELRHIFIIAISASNHHDIRHKSLEAGCNTFLPKPIYFETLLSVFSTYLQIEWIYEHDRSPLYQEFDDHHDTETTTVFSLPEDDRERLIEFARLGISKEIQSLLDRLEQHNKASIPIIRKLRKFVKDYQFNQIVKLVSSEKTS